MINDKKISMISALLVPRVIENSENFISGLTDKIIENFELRQENQRLKIENSSISRVR